MKAFNHRVINYIEGTATQIIFFFIFIFFKEFEKKTINFKQIIVSTKYRDTCIQQLLNTIYTTHNISNVSTIFAIIIIFLQVILALAPPCSRY